MKNIFLTLVLGMFSLNSFALDINGEPYEFTGSISTITLTDEGGVINAVGETGQYGKVWLTYNLNLDNPATPNQGSFTGRAVAIDGDGYRNSATRQGVWERKGKIMHFKSLDDVSDGNQYLCITSINLIDDSLEMKFYSVK
ncbi:hypothetical protein N9H86_01920 [Gammaproteobacteria bacterium]|nr:hypothetical protein [Gammaproteobacteria bacterium]